MHKTIISTVLWPSADFTVFNSHENRFTVAVRLFDNFLDGWNDLLNLSIYFYQFKKNLK